MNRTISIPVMAIIIATSLTFFSCASDKDDDTSSSRSTGEPSSSSAGEDQSSSSAGNEASSSSVSIGSWLTCGRMEYLPEDNAFCFVDECAPDPDCPECDVCYREERLLQKCEGKEYDPKTHYCSRTGCMHVDCVRAPCYDVCEKEELLEFSSGLPKCEGKEYFPGTHFCYVDTCGRLPSCRENPDRPCPAVCYPEEKILERCGGKEYNPKTEVCYNGQNVICMNQIKNCGYSGVYTDCQGNNPVEIILDFYQTNCVPPVAY